LAIDKGAATELLVVDELGHLELRGGGLVRALELIQGGQSKELQLINKL
jgi:nucleoside-triphosphatase THEP1